MLRPTVSRPVCLGVSIHLGLTTRFLFLSDRCGFVDVGRSLWRENGSAIYNCCWSSPAQSFLGQSPAGLVTIFYCLRFETPPTWRARSPYLCPPGTGWSGLTPRHWVTPPSSCMRSSLYSVGAASTENTASSHYCVSVYCCRNVFEIVRMYNIEKFYPGTIFFLRK
jgi:hypothetical protein